MTAPAFPTYPKMKRSFGGFNYGMYLALKALYNQVNNLTLIEPEEKLKLDSLFDEVEKQIPDELKEQEVKPKDPKPEKEIKPVTKPVKSKPVKKVKKKE